MQMMNKKIKTTKSIRQVRAVHLNIYKNKMPSEKFVVWSFLCLRSPPENETKDGDNFMISF